MSDQSAEKLALSRDDMMAAVTQGIREGFADIASDWGKLDVPHEIVHDAIRLGVKQAFWEMITNATQMPCADFYEAIQDGVRLAMAQATSTPCARPAPRGGRVG